MQNKKLEQQIENQKKENKRLEDSMIALMVLDAEAKKDNLDPYFKSIHDNLMGNGIGKINSPNKMILGIIDQINLNNLQKLYPGQHQNIRKKIEDKRKDPVFVSNNFTKSGSANKVDAYYSESFQRTLSIKAVLDDSFPPKDGSSLSQNMAKFKDFVKGIEDMSPSEQGLLMVNYQAALLSGDDPNNLSLGNTSNMMSDMSNNKSINSFMVNLLNKGVDFMKSAGYAATDIAKGVAEAFGGDGGIFDKAKGIFTAKAGKILTIGVLTLSMASGFAANATKDISLDQLNNPFVSEQVVDQKLGESQFAGNKYENIFSEVGTSAQLFSSDYKDMATSGYSEDSQIFTDGRYDDVHHGSQHASEITPDNYRDIAEQHFNNVARKMGAGYRLSDFSVEEQNQVLDGIVQESADLTNVSVTEAMDPGISYKFGSIAAQTFVSDIKIQDMGLGEIQNNPVTESATSSKSLSFGIIEQNKIQKINSILDGVSGWNGGQFETLEARDQLYLLNNLETRSPTIIGVTASGKNNYMVEVSYNKSIVEGFAKNHMEGNTQSSFIQSKSQGELEAFAMSQINKTFESAKSAGWKYPASMFTKQSIQPLVDAVLNDARMASPDQIEQAISNPDKAFGTGASINFMQEKASQVTEPGSPRIRLGRSGDLAQNPLADSHIKEISESRQAFKDSGFSITDSQRHYLQGSDGAKKPMNPFVDIEHRSLSDKNLVENVGESNITNKTKHDLSGPSM